MVLIEVILTLLVGHLLQTNCAAEEKSLECLCNDNHYCIQQTSLLTPNLTSDEGSNITTGVCYVDTAGRCYTAKVVILSKRSADGKAPKGNSMILRYGCISSHEQSMLACKGHLPNHMVPKTIACCNNTNLCNRGLDPSFVHHETAADAIRAGSPPIWSRPDGWVDDNRVAEDTTSHSLNPVVKVGLLAAFSCLLVVVIASLMVICYFYRKRVWSQRGEHATMMAMSSAAGDTDMCYVPLVKETMSNGIGNGTTNSTSGTGSGPALLVQRTVAKQLSLHQFLGQGRFGEVWSGEWCGEPVAIKLYHSGPTGEMVWRHETSLHQNVLLRHDCVLGLVAADHLVWASLHRPVLVTDLLTGSLRDVLAGWSEEVERTQALLLGMAKSVSAGLCYLHTEISGTRGKPEIAHRDLTSSNVYVKPDWTCCIGDLGLALTQRANQSSAGPSLTKTNERVEGGDAIDEAAQEWALVGGLQAGTPRYMAPEVLSRSLNPLFFESFKKADIYAMGLLFWELTRAFPPTDQSDTATKVVPELPFLSELGHVEEPTVEEMSELVCTHIRRPHLPSNWTDDTVTECAPVTAYLMQLMTECWHDQADYRLTALRVKKTLYRLHDDIISADHISRSSSTESINGLHDDLDPIDEMEAAPPVNCVVAKATESDVTRFEDSHV